MWIASPKLLIEDTRKWVQKKETKSVWSCEHVYENKPKLEYDKEKSQKNGNNPGKWNEMGPSFFSPHFIWGMVFLLSSIVLVVRGPCLW